MADVETQQEAAAGAREKAAGMSVDPNYQYWRDHGGEWVDHYDSRKKRMVLYHIQELMLTSYIHQHADRAGGQRLRVLELGCGVGRHLRNLSKLENVDVYGYDQSRAMAEGVLRWASREWFNEHVRVGMPTGRLPFEDGSFDIVYTAEVLVHVRPEHLEGILRELVRVCRGHVLHLETSPDFPLVSGEHSGCWRHDLPGAYQKLGLACEVLAAGYAAHTPFRVAVGAPASWTWPSQIIGMYRQMERDLDEGFGEVESAAQLRERDRELLTAKEAVIAEQAHALHVTRGQVAELQHNLAGAKAQVAGLEKRIAELDAALAHAAELRGALHEENERLRAQYADMSRARDWAMAQVAALNAHIAKMSAGWDHDRAGLQKMIEERRRFVAQAFKQLDGE